MSRTAARTGCCQRWVSCAIGGSVSVHANKHVLRSSSERGRSGNLQHVRNDSGTAKELQSSVSGGDLLIGSRADAEEVAQFIVASTEPLGRARALEPKHRPV